MMTNDLHHEFLALLPAMEAHARHAFRGWRNEDDLIAEAVALCWSWFLKLHQGGKADAVYASALAGFAVKHAAAGRKLATPTNSRDVLSEACRQRHGVQVEALPANVIDARLTGSRSPVADQAAFRIDFPAWLATRTDRDRRIIDAMIADAQTLDIAEQFGLTPGRVSQLRRAYQADWERFTATG